MSRDEDALRVVRILHVTMILSVLSIGAIGEFVRGHGPIDENPANVEIIHKAFLVMLVAALGVVTMLRSRWVGPAAESLRSRPDDEAAWNRWRGGNITSFALCESIALFGFVLRLLGGTLAQAAPFYAVGVLLLVVLAPRNPAH